MRSWLTHSPKTSPLSTLYVFALVRSLFANFSTLYFSAAIVTTLGSKDFASLIIITTLASVIFYAATFFFEEGVATKVFAVIMATNMLVMISIAVAPSASALLFAGALLSLFLDAVGANVSNDLLVRMTNPAVYLEHYQRVSLIELSSRLGAAALLWATSALGLLSWAHYLMLVLAGFQLFFFVPLLNAIPRTPKSHTAGDGRLESTKLALGFMWKSPLMRNALLIALWGCTIKFIIEFVFYVSLESNLPSQADASSALSAVNILIIIVSLFVQKSFGNLLFSKVPFSVLCAIAPIGIFALGSPLLFLDSLTFPLLLMCFFQISNRSITLPLTRQCFAATPARYRTQVLFLVCIATSLATLVSSSAVRFVLADLQRLDQTLLLLFVGVSVLLFVTQLDAAYLKTMLNFFTESKGLNTIQSTDSFAISMPTQSPQEPAQVVVGANLSSPLLLRYASAQSTQELELAWQAHSSALHGEAAEEGVELFFIVANVEARARLRWYAVHGTEKLKVYATALCELNEVLDALPIARFPTTTRRRLRELLVKHLRAGNRTLEVERLLLLVQHRNRKGVKQFVDTLYEEHGSELSAILYGCIDLKAARVSLIPFVQRMIEIDFRQATKYRAVLEKFKGLKEISEIVRLMEKNIVFLYESRFSIWKASEPGQTSVFLHTLYLTEWSIIKYYRKTGFILASFETGGDLSEQDKQILSRIHLEFLKHHDLFEVWTLFMARKVDRWSLRRAVRMIHEMRQRVEPTPPRSSIKSLSKG